MIIEFKQQEDSFKSEAMNMIICSPPVYKFNGWTFEFNPYNSPPWPVKTNGDPCKKAGKKFYDDIEKFLKMTDDERYKYRIGGGCEII